MSLPAGIFPPMREHSALKGLAEKWAGAKAAERANAQSYLIELCEALGLERPRPAGTGYEFELPIKVIARDGTEAQNFIDLYKERHFLLEAKDADGGKNTDLLLRRAFGQARTYAAHVPGGVAPPYLLVLDVGKTLLVWDRWSGSNVPMDAAGHLIYRDNNGAFEEPFVLGLMQNGMAWLRRSQRFSASVIARARALTDASIREEMALDGDPAHPPLTEAQRRSLLRRRDALLEYIDGLIRRHGEAAVLAF